MPRLARSLLAAIVVLAFPPVAAAADPAARFDAPGQHHADACVRLAAGSAPLRFGDGSPTGFLLGGGQLVYDLGSCPSGTATLDLHEAIPSPAGPLVFHRGGSGYEDRGNVKYGALAAPDLAEPPPLPVPSSGGRGAPCSLANEPPYLVDVRSITSRMHYKSTGGASYVPYGDPAADQGENDESIHYTYLLWSWIDVAGGGTVRTLLSQGQVVRACDVASITSPSFGSDGEVNGEVTARYVQALAGSCPVYGWMAWSHTFNGNRAGAIAHAAALTAPPAPAPAPDPACPVADAASPPAVATAGARPASQGPRLAASVNPKGVPTTYQFQLGTTSAYGTATPRRSLGPVDEGVAVTAPVQELVPGAVYHYRVVAASTHGVGYGADRVLRPPKLKRLRVRPKAKRIEFRLSARATVRITFERIAAGGHRRPVRGSLTRKAKPGRVSLAISGRRLRKGRYVATVAPRGTSGHAGASLTARFTVR